MINTQIPEYTGDYPTVSGFEDEILSALKESKKSPVYLNDSDINFDSIHSAAAIALHMQQPLIPAGGEDLETADMISNLQYMMDNQHIGDNHNAPGFHWCYKRIGEFIPNLVNEGKSPRVMLEYSGVLLHGLRKMGLHDVIDTLKNITCDSKYRSKIEWLGCPWGHAVAPSTPTQDFKLQIQAWQQHFAGIFGMEALSRVRGFSPSEMALPNHPDISYEYVKSLKDCGYDWVLVQEHTIEIASTGHHPHQSHLPHRLECKNSKGDTVSIIAIVKTQGSDTKLVAQMQPWYEAKSLNRWDLSGKSVPPLVTQIADGENGGVMMNEFPSKFNEVASHCTGTQTPLMNATEYLEFLSSRGITEDDFQTVQPVKQKQIWDIFEAGEGPEKLEKTIKELKEQDSNFHMDGGSWTDDISWVNGYDNVLVPMEQASASFYQKVLKQKVPTTHPNFNKALFYLMSSQTSCYRYWGQGLWTDYGKEICRRAEAIVENDF